jgi:hypothetical protein
MALCRLLIHLSFMLSIPAVGIGTSALFIISLSSAHPAENGAFSISEKISLSFLN